MGRRKRSTSYILIELPKGKLGIARYHSLLFDPGGWRGADFAWSIRRPTNKQAEALTVFKVLHIVKMLTLDPVVCIVYSSSIFSSLRKDHSDNLIRGGGTMSYCPF